MHWHGIQKLVLNNVPCFIHKYFFCTKKLYLPLLNFYFFFCCIQVMEIVLPMISTVYCIHTRSLSKASCMLSHRSEIKWKRQCGTFHFNCTMPMCITIRTMIGRIQRSLSYRNKVISVRTCLWHIRKQDYPYIHTIIDVHAVVDIIT